MVGVASVSAPGIFSFYALRPVPTNVLPTVSTSAGTAQLLSISDKKPPRTRSTSLDFIQNRLGRLKLGSSKRSGQSDSDVKGPLGLNLLHEPSEPKIDFIFIHGLGGGSRKSWSYSPEPGMFWPKDWLPNEVGFKHVRLHSYGYNSEWTSRKGSSLTIHDFGQALIADIHNSPCFRKNGDVSHLDPATLRHSADKGSKMPIVFVAHSMGGLVAKKATRDPTYQTIARRVHTIYFLGTPHRGTDSAQVARLVQYSANYGPKAFIDDLLPGSVALDQINDDFRHICGKICLWSFFEGVPTSFGLMSSLVVDKESAVLRLPGEHIQYIEADHRHLCKFDSPVSPNYLILQRSFLTTIEELEANSLFQQRDEYRSQRKLVSSLLRVDQRPDAFLLAINQKQHHGTCQWLTGDHAFQEWVDNPADWQDIDPTQKFSEDSPPKVLWLNGRPGTGKSVASGHVIRYLETCNFDCSFYFFRHNDKAGSTVSGLLRSLAFQMAQSNFEVRRAIVAMVEDDVRINHDDHHTLWSKLFVDRVFKVEFTRPQFWVIDAVDECSSKGIPAFVSMLSSLEDKIPVRIFMTSRPGGQLERLLTLEQTNFREINTGQSGSFRDIELFLRARCPQAGDTGSYQSLVADVLSKSNGIFLRASLTTARLEDTYSVEDMQDILRQIPSEMDEFYSRIIKSIAVSPSCELAKCILKWTICSPKPLTMGELGEAVKLDIGRTLTASASQLESITGHLIFVGSLSRIYITHQTTSAFLTQQRGDFWIDRTVGHSRLAEICLIILCGSEFAPPRTRRKGLRCQLVSSAIDTSLVLLNKFLRSNVLTWIERMAGTGNLSTLQHTAQRLKAYMHRRAKYQTPVSVEIQTVAAWVTDIYHIIAAFHSSLLTSPSSIYFLIPHYCPPKSIIRQLFAKQSRRLRITGPLEEDWNDRLTCYLFSGEALSVACCDRFLAVGLANGDIRIYNSARSSTFDSVGTLTHRKKVRQLAFNQSSSLLASCSVRRLMLWDIHRSSGSLFQCLWSQDVDFTTSDMMFSPDGNSITLSNHQHSKIVTFRVMDGLRGEPVLLHGSSDSDSSDGCDQQLTTWTPSERVRLDPCHRLAALAYRDASVSLWDLDAVERIGYFKKEGHENVYASSPTLDMIFNPLPELELFAVTYLDGDIVTCNPWILEQTGKYRLQISLFSLAATSDGRVLAGGAQDGAVYLFLFETLLLFYHIKRPDEQFLIRNITFAADNLRFFDIRGQCCNVWEPFVLVPKDGSDDSSSEPQSEELVIQEPVVSRAHVFQWGEAITAIEPTADGSLFFLGRQDGTIDICELSTGAAVDKLRLHDGFAKIQHMDWNDENRLLLSVDTTGRCIVTQLSFSGNDTKPKTNGLLDRRERDIVRQALISPNAASFLIHTFSGVKLIDTNGDLMAEETTLPEGCWMRHPYNPSLLIVTEAGKIHIFDWSSLKRLSAASGIALLAPEVALESDSGPWMGRSGSSYIARGFTRLQVSVSDFVALETSKITPESKEAQLQIRDASSLSVWTMIGVSKSSLYFLDMSGWVCSVSLKNLKDATHYTRHFFIPPIWHTGGDIVITIISKTAVAFGRGDQLIVFHGFLEFEEKVAFGEESALTLRPSF